jgi:mono/diheme cytochrome c family protein
VQAIYAFLMTRAPVQVQVPRNHLPFPVSVRGSVALWNALYLKDGVLQPVPGQSAQWNRGAYLAEALAHCSACHTPRNLLGAEKKALPYAGGEADGWHPPALNRSSAAPTPWTSEQVYTYLRRGSEDAHGLAGGPMAEVVSNLSRVPDDDVRAIAVYIASLSAQPAPIAKARAAEGSSGDAQTVARGQVIYAGACASCHDGGRRGNGALDLSLSTAVAMPTPANLVQIVRNGLTPAAGERGAWMPAFGAAITDAQLADLAAYLREHFAGKPAWKDVAGAAKKVREEQAKLSQASAR